MQSRCTSEAFDISSLSLCFLGLQDYPISLADEKKKSLKKCQKIVQSPVKRKGVGKIFDMGCPEFLGSIKPKFTTAIGMLLVCCCKAKLDLLQYTAATICVSLELHYFDNTCTIYESCTRTV